MARVRMNEIGEHAVVLGAGMAGLLAASVLSEFYQARHRHAHGNGAKPLRGIWWPHRQSRYTKIKKPKD
jgi:hypothetical protein